MEKPRYRITTDNVETAIQFYFMGKAYTHSSRAAIEKKVQQIDTCPELSFIDDIEALLESDMKYVYKAIQGSSDPRMGLYAWSSPPSQAEVLDFILAANVPSWKLMYNIIKTRAIVKLIQAYKKSATSKVIAQ